MRKLFDFKCQNNHVTERYTEPETRQIECPECSNMAERIISAVPFILDGCDPGYPGAYDKWAKDRISQANKERKANES